MYGIIVTIFHTILNILKNVTLTEFPLIKASSKYITKNKVTVKITFFTVFSYCNSKSKHSIPECDDFSFRTRYCFLVD